MAEIKCPKCGTTFKVDNASYADILRQVRSAEFESELHDRLKQVEEKAASDQKLALAKMEAEISELKSKIAQADTEKKLAIAEAVAPIEKQRDQYANDLKNKDTQAKLREAAIVEKYKGAIELRDDEIERLKDMKARQSTKMVGESLEQHCQTEFNRIRMTAFPNAYFEKDNDSRTGSKGDFIFRENDEHGNEIISIMFEMKNENETTATKHKNEDFFKELDKDRREKKCEYAVLVSLLEADSEYYNTGIVDVSYRYEKMYVIRPQFFIQIITLLRNAAMNALKYKAELAVVREQNIDITHFEDDMNEWKAGWLNTMKNAGKKHLEAIEQINKAIKDLEKTRDALMLSDKHLASAEGKLDDLTIKKLTRGNPTMKAKFDELEKS